jgi:NAD(P)H dehydrogenase (quinone)
MSTAMTFWSCPMLRMHCPQVTCFLLPLTLLAALAAAEPPAAAPAEISTAQVLIVYYSQHGNTQQMADAVGEGAARVDGVRVKIQRVEDCTSEDLRAADGLVLGCATYFTNIPGPMKLAMDDWNWKWKVDFTDKVGGAFTTGGGQTGGKEFTAVSLLLFMLSNRMMVAGPLYEAVERGTEWGELGSSAMTGPLDPGISEGELDGARRLGERIARLAQRMKNSR